MELKQFISEALLNIVDGVDEANSKHKGRFRIIGVHHGKTGSEGVNAEFDVSVTVEEKSGAKTSGEVGGKIGSVLSVLSAGVKSEIGKSDSLQNAHRLKFKIFISEK